MSRYVGAGRVDDVGEVPCRDALFDEFLPNSRFMKELAVIMPTTGRSTHVIRTDGELEESLHEWRGQ